MPLNLSSLKPLLPSRRTLLILLALLNLKTLPFIWHLRLLYRFIRNFYSSHDVRRILSSSSTTTHPIFSPVSTHTHAPLSEIDYNLHKSNATYFTDLDESRTALVTRLYGPAFRKNDKTLEKQGHRGRVAVILGSVHTSFHREIRPYERYEVRSRVVGWDRKWLVVGTWFVRPAKGRGKGKGKGKEEEGEVLLASSLSKYVVKKGKLTVSPERVLRLGGWLPEREEQQVDDGLEIGGGKEKTGEESTVFVNKANVDSEMSEVQPTPQSESDAVVQPVPESVMKTAEVVERLEKVASNVKGNVQELDAKISEAPRAAEWDWHRVEMERLRGLQIASGWLDLDSELAGEYRKRPH